jgi:hypothetical protein
MIRARKFRFAALAALGLLMAGAPGCGDGSGRVAVSGRVTVDGQALESGVIAFLPAEGTKGPAAGAEIKQGAYSVGRQGGPLPGTYRVEIKGTRKTGRQIKDSFSTAMVDEIEQFLPAKFNTESELSAEIKPGGSDSLDFTLQLK